MVRRFAAWWRGWRYHWQHDTRPEPRRGCEHGEDTWRDGVTRCYACNPAMFDREWLPRTPQIDEALWAGAKLDGYSMLNSSPMTAELAHELDWREQTMAELSPEALDLPQGPQAAASWGISPGPGDGASSLAPGPGVTAVLGGPGPRESRSVAICRQDGYDVPPTLERLADTGDIRDAGLLAEVTAFMRDQDADVADWLAGRAMTWARLEIGALT